MPRYRVTTGDGQKFVVEAPEGVTEDQIRETVQASATKLGMYDPPKPEPKPEEPQWVMARGLDILTNRTKNKEAQQKLQHPAIGAVEGALPSAMTAATIPLAGAGGQVAAKLAPAVPKLAAAVGEAVTQGSLGAAEQMVEGASGAHATHTGMLDTATSLGTSALMSLIPAKKLLGLTKPMKELIEDFKDREKAYKLATDSIKTAFDKIGDRIPAGKWMNLPSISKTKVTAKEAQAALERLEGPEFEIARKEIISELNRLDIRNPKLGRGEVKNPRASYAGQEFETRVKDFRQKPTMKPEEKTAQRAISALNAARPVASTLTTRPVEGTGGVPFGALAVNAMAGGIPRHIPGGRIIRDVVGDESE